MYEIRLHSRGGQGGVTAAKLLAQAAFLDGKYATATPLYGAERRGAPVVSFIRIDDEPVRIYSQIRKPDLVIVLDASVMQTVDVMHGIKPDGKVLINSPHKMEFGGHKVYNVDLTGVALSLDLVVAGNPILNTPLLGAVAKMGLVSRESVRKAIAGSFKDKRNADAALKAYEELVL
ncbi:pyruvate ferredoxin oxidoreductase gamma subunit [Methanomicrobium sp. W14]|uniref:2-oxoacid:acceptor oxidoreductase family protein n=1 Tax=Methanomicrobium sp. W14 TaxID=2817839 RepID=UPI001AE7198A|nr:2-oxoacid:acceptor oxidoreductase family protein [Methanomicrobium sp. W14]MBP2133790.1 pyruvate ferredoxin oxidoreductase gamma subunit [Methanomicrobium sp. W14]